MTADLVQQAVASGLSFDTVLFDGRFAAGRCFPGYGTGKDRGSGCPKDRRVLVQNRWTQIQQFSPSVPAEAGRSLEVNDRLWWVFGRATPMGSLHYQRARIIAAYTDELNLIETLTFYATTRRD
jgi:hypothetical protein